MIGRLRGTVLGEDADGVVLDVAGVGYEVTVPLGTLGRAAVDAGGLTTLYIHTHVREDALSLFGFASAADRLAFRTLLGVSSVGPKTAVMVLSALPSPELGLAVARKDLASLTRIPGIGKKTAERLLLELRDKLPVAPDPGDALASGKRPPGGARSQAHVLEAALVGMGYKAQEAERAVAALGERAEGTPLAALVKEALAILSK